jgi:hypothetical protein
MKLGMVILQSVALALAACSTTVTTRQALEPATVRALKVDSVEVMSSLDAVPTEAQAQLKKAVIDRLAKMPTGVTPARVRITITEYQVASGTARMFAGALAGANRMTVSVNVVVDEGKQLAEFDVTRSANPGGYGVFFDQQAEMINAVADGVAEVLAAGSKP